MKEIFSSLYEKYYESINNFIQTFSGCQWVLIGLTFIGFLIKIPLLFLIPLSFGSYLAFENQTVHELIQDKLSVSPEIAVFGLWTLCIFIRIFAIKPNNNQNFSNLVKNVLSFSLVFVLTIAIGTPAFKESMLNEFKFVIMIGIFLYALYHIFKHSIGLIKNVLITFAWVFIITILGMQSNPEVFKNLFNKDRPQTFSQIKSELRKTLDKQATEKFNVMINNNLFR